MESCEIYPLLNFLFLMKCDSLSTNFDWAAHELAKVGLGSSFESLDSQDKTIWLKSTLPRLMLADLTCGLIGRGPTEIGYPANDFIGSENPAHWKFRPFSFDVDYIYIYLYI